MPAHPLQKDLDSLDEEWSRLQSEFAAKINELRTKRTDILDRIAADLRVTPDVPHLATDLTQQTMVPEPGHEVSS